MHSCEKENRRIDERDYAVDVAMVPRGGHRRRKSMEPKALSAATATPGDRPPPSQLSPTKEFLTFSAQSSPVRVAAVAHTTHTPERYRVPPPTTARPRTVFATPTSPPPPLSFSPTGGYGDDDHARLVQETCPPKQTRELFFPPLPPPGVRPCGSGGGASADFSSVAAADAHGMDKENRDAFYGGAVRRRVALARRKSLQFAPKVGSPLARQHFVA